MTQDLSRLRITRADTGWHAPFFDHVATVFAGVDFRAWAALDGWTDDYEVRALIEDGRIIASVGRTRMRLTVADRTVDVVQLGAVATRADRRGRGLARALLDGVLAEADAGAAPVILFANPRVLDFYPRFGFRRVEQHVFAVDMRADPSAAPAPLLDKDDARDRATLFRIAGLALSQGRIAFRDYGPILLWHLCDRPMQMVLAGPETIAVVSQDGATLHLHDLLAPDRPDLAALLPRLAQAPVDRVVFGFDPASLGLRSVTAMPDPESYLFIRGLPDLPAAPLRLPDLAQT